MTLGVGRVEDFIRQLRDGGWEMFEQLDDKISAATQTRRPKINDDDRRTIQTAWAEFAASPAGEMALQQLVDRTLNQPVALAHLGYSAEQVAIYGSHREGQNFLVNVILNQIRLAQEEPTQQRES